MAHRRSLVSSRNINGQSVGSWYVISDSGERLKSGRRACKCRCVCGRTKLVDKKNLITGKTTSCGCVRPSYRKLFLKYKAEYKLWANIKSRCTNSNATGFKNYGGRGIRVCERWYYSFENFLEDMGQKPFRGATIERIDNNGDYEPSNCRWANKSEQCSNKRNNRILRFNGIDATLTEWSRATGMCRETIARRLDSGWSVDDALTIEPHEPKMSGYKWNVTNPLARKVIIGGSEKTLDEWSRDYGINYRTVLNRINNMGMDPVDALQKPLMRDKDPVKRILKRAARDLKKYQCGEMADRVLSLISEYTS